MKKCLVLAARNMKEMLREPLCLVFCLGFPIIMLVIMQIVFKSMEFVPPNFAIESYASGICVFGFTFVSLFIAMHIAADKNTSFINRINISPISRASYLFGFFLAALPVAVAQMIIFFLLSLAFGFPFDGNFVLGIIYLLPSAVFYVCIGILVGTLCKTEKQTGPLSSIFISLTGIFGGIFMPIDSFSGGFATFINILPFGHSVQIASELHTVGASCIYPHILYLLGYIAAIVAAIVVIERVKSLKR